MIRILLTAFAIWKVTAMLMHYEGPLRIIERTRNGIHSIQERAGHKLLNFACFFCLSTVIAIPAALLLADGWDIPIYWFGLAGIAWFLNLIDERFS